MLKNPSISNASVSTTEKQSTPLEGYDLMLPQIFIDTPNLELSAFPFSGFELLLRKFKRTRFEK